VLLLLKVSEPFSTCLTLFLDELKDEDRGEQGGGALGTAVQLGQQLPALDGGDGALADGADFGVSLVDGRLPLGQARTSVVAFERVRIVPPAP
jgi:hypothetical protein